MITNTIKMITNAFLAFIFNAWQLEKKYENDKRSISE